MHPLLSVRSRALSVITLAIAAGLMCQAPAFAETSGTTPITTAPVASTVSKVSTTDGIETGGTQVIISGTNFIGVTGVAFGVSPATSYTATSDTSITAVAPALRAGVHKISVTNPAGTVFAAKFTVRTFEAEVLRLVNQARGTARKCGSSTYKAARALRFDSKLAKVAAAHSLDMAVNNYFSHDTRSGRSPFSRMKQAGYRYHSAGENIAAGFRTPASVVKAWIASPGHCRNLMNRGYAELGVGFASGGTYGTYWTQDFGNPR
jgi:uncharacterized protein YkwD